MIVIYSPQRIGGIAVFGNGEVLSDGAALVGAIGSTNRRRRLYLGPDKKVNIEAEPAKSAVLPTPVAVEAPKAAAPLESVADVLRRVSTTAPSVFRPAPSAEVAESARQAAEAIEAAAIAKQRLFEDDDQAAAAAAEMLLA